MQRNTRYIVVAVMYGLLALNAGVARAQTVELVTKAEREFDVVEKGAKVRKVEPAQKIVPGDDVLYTITYNNKTGKPADKIIITNPVPKNTRYRDGTAAGDGADITYSVDDGKSFAAPGQLTVAIKDKSGKDIARPAVAQDYTHIRWVLRQSVAPGQSGSVRFRAVVL